MVIILCITSPPSFLVFLLLGTIERDRKRIFKRVIHCQRLVKSTLDSRKENCVQFQLKERLLIL
jgi:hypothetical protein